MSTNQWEVVTKSRKQRNMERKVEAHMEKKRLAAVPIKLEEILPSQEYRNIISGRDSGSLPTATTIHRAEKPKSKSPPKKSKEAKQPIAAAKSEQNINKKQSSQPKLPPKPKSPELALRQLTPQEFSTQLQQLKLTFPGSELLWLRGVASLLNTKLPFDSDPTFAGKVTDYPSNLLTLELRAALDEFLRDMGFTNVSYFYHTLLTSMAMELAKNSPAFGCKLLLQLIARNWPEICSDNMAKTALLRNSYLNRSNVCLSILWAVGQGGYECLIDGIRVWQNLMLPNLEMRSYTKFVTEYIEKILKSSPDSSLENLSDNEFVLTLNALRDSYCISKDYEETLRRALELFLKRCIPSSMQPSTLFLTLMRETLPDGKSNIELDACISALCRSDDCINVWRMSYNELRGTSAALIIRIDQKWDEIELELCKSEAFEEFIQQTITELPIELRSGGYCSAYETHILEVLNGIQEKILQQKKKQSAEKKNSCCCFWTLGSMALIVLIGCALAYDTNVNGKGVFARSACGKALQKAGMLPHVEKAWYVTMSANARAYKWAEQNVPPYVQPAMTLTSDLYKLTRNAACSIWSKLHDYVSAKLPQAAEFLENYMPGLPKKIEGAFIEGRQMFNSVIAQITAFLKTQVFVGHLSPENLSRALNRTTIMATEYYKLFEKKVDFYAKLK